MVGIQLERAHEGEPCLRVEALHTVGAAEHVMRSGQGRIEIGGVACHGDRAIYRAGVAPVVQEKVSIRQSRLRGREAWIERERLVEQLHPGDVLFVVHQRNHPAGLQIEDLYASRLAVGRFSTRACSSGDRFA